MRDPGRIEAAEGLYEAAHLSELLANDPRTGAPEIRVDVTGTTVTVTGSVTTEERRRAIEAVLREAHPELQVRNDVNVVDLSGPPSTEEIR